MFSDDIIYEFSKRIKKKRSKKKCKKKRDDRSYFEENLKWFERKTPYTIGCTTVSSLDEDGSISNCKRKEPEYHLDYFRAFMDARQLQHLKDGKFNCTVVFTTDSLLTLNHLSKERKGVRSYISKVCRNAKNRFTVRSTLVENGFRPTNAVIVCMDKIPVAEYADVIMAWKHEIDKLYKSQIWEVPYAIHYANIASSRQAKLKEAIVEVCCNCHNILIGTITTKKSIDMAELFKEAYKRQLDLEKACKEKADNPDNDDSDHPPYSKKKVDKKIQQFIKEYEGKYNLNKCHKPLYKGAIERGLIKFYPRHHKRGVFIVHYKTPAWYRRARNLRLFKKYRYLKFIKPRLGSKQIVSKIKDVITHILNKTSSLSKREGGVEKYENWKFKLS